MQRIVLALWAVGLWGQALPEPELVRMGPGVTEPVLVKKVEPKFSPEALEAKISGAVAVSMVVSAEGVPTRIRVVRPLGMGWMKRRWRRCRSGGSCRLSARACRRVWQRRFK